MDTLTRRYLLLWGGVALGLVMAVTGVVLVLSAYVPPADILTTNGKPVPFFETIKPIPFGIGVTGVVVIVAFAMALLRGRTLRHW